MGATERREATSPPPPRSSTGACVRILRSFEKSPPPPPPLSGLIVLCPHFVDRRRGANVSHRPCFFSFFSVPEKGLGAEENTTCWGGKKPKSSSTPSRLVSPHTPFPAALLLGHHFQPTRNQKTKTPLSLLPLLHPHKTTTTLASSLLLLPNSTKTKK